MIHYYSDFKNFLEAIIGLDRNVLHVHLGIALFIFLSLLFSGANRYRKALFWLLVFELVNEFIDAMMAFDRGRSPNWPDTVADIINTMIWPTVWCLWRHYRRLRAERAIEARTAATTEAAAGTAAAVDAWVDPLARTGVVAPSRNPIGTSPPDKGDPA